MRVVCQIRRDKGCQDPRIVQLDQHENHGRIPEGPICADLPQTPSFETFCLFAQFRCSNQQLYTKRILCPKRALESAAQAAKESGAPTERPNSFMSETGEKRPQTSPLKEAAPSQEISKLLIKAPSPPLNIDVRANIDEILKYAFAVSGQEPVPKAHSSVLHDNGQTLQASKFQEWSDYSKAWLVAAPTETSISNVQKIETTEGQIGPSFQQDLRPAFLKEKPLNVENAQAPIDGKTQQNFQEAIPETKSKGSLFDLEKGEALVILCYALLQDNCITSAVSKAWKQMEAKTLGYGDLVCDNLGRRHADLCSECAFCSLKTEQCQGVSDLNRIPCDGGTFTTYINPGVLTQHQAKSTTVAPLKKGEQFNGKMQDVSQLQYWCGILATYGCDDSRVALWLQTEYSQFHRGDFPDKICDSARIVHPTYCAFKSYECLQNSKSRKKVRRHGCRRNMAYHVLSKEEGEKEVQLWSQKFLNIAQG
ncbi:acrosin-binding protein [Tiliqua scincoides]|uniref:acrosin-binding protein n=1 Tax=Tiliqua scincoides TaxID=71010 RepID=UPI003462997A